MVWLWVSATRKWPAESWATPVGSTKRAAVPSALPSPEGTPARAARLPTHTLAWAVASLPAALVTVRVKTVVRSSVPVGTEAWLSTAPTPLSTVAVAPGPAWNTAVSWVEVPVPMIAAPAENCWMTGSGTTVTMASREVDSPLPAVTVRV